MNVPLHALWTSTGNKYLDSDDITVQNDSQISSHSSDDWHCRHAQNIPSHAWSSEAGKESAVLSSPKTYRNSIAPDKSN